MEFKGTQGNWGIIDINLSAFKQSTIVSKNPRKVIAHMYLPDYEITEEISQNAKLISKVPEMLELLNQFVSISDELNVPEHLIETFANLYANSFNIIQEATEI